MKTIKFLMTSFIVCSLLGGCYVYTNEPVPPPVPAVIIVPPGTPPPPIRTQPLPPPAPSGPPAGAIGPPR